MREREPLGSLLDGLGVSLKTENDLHPHREWKHIDLVIRDRENDSAIVAIEMKVDSYEGLVGGVPQTIAYRKLLEEDTPDTPFLFVTLGVGEFYHAPHGELVEWIRLRDFHEALKGISTTISSSRDGVKP
jgi:hypothetical protein